MKNDEHLTEICVRVAGMLSTFGPLSHTSLEAFVDRYCEMNEWVVPENYYEDRVVPALSKSRLACSYKGNRLANCIMADDKNAGQDAFWLFMEHMKEAELDTIMAGPWPSQVTYLRRGNLYHIVRCSGSGDTELGSLAANERAVQSERRVGIDGVPEEKFILLFGSMEALRASALVIKGPVIRGVIQYKNPNEAPDFYFE